MLYVDEVNLLHDHLVDLLLDAAALGTSYVEREGVSVRHAARFLLVGTMNPEEGELRPQLLDRFGLTVEVAATRDPAERAEVVRRRLAYEADPDGFAAPYAAADAELAARIAAPASGCRTVVLADQALREVTTVCAAFDVDGLRADLVTAKAAVALAAWAGRDRGHHRRRPHRRAAGAAAPPPAHAVRGARARRASSSTTRCRLGAAGRRARTAGGGRRRAGQHGPPTTVRTTTAGRRRRPDRRRRTAEADARRRRRRAARRRARRLARGRASRRPPPRDRSSTRSRCACPA